MNDTTLSTLYRTHLHQFDWVNEIKITQYSQGAVDPYGGSDEYGGGDAYGGSDEGKGPGGGYGK